MNANPADYPIGSGIELMQLEDEHLAELGFTVYDYNTNPQIISYGTAKWWTCLKASFGLASDGAGAYWNGTKMLMTAKRAFTLVRAFAIRSLGFIGVLIAVNDYYNCMK